ncbi:MAG: NUDIX hydrolase [Magnetococcus sp. YQC-5]
MSQNNIVFSTPWFHVEAMASSGQGEAEHHPYYRIVEQDGVCAVVLTMADEVVLIRQYRPAIEKEILEFPAGAVRSGESLLAATSRELIEETGYQCTTWVYGGSTLLRPDRCTNRSYGFLGVGATPVADWQGPAGIKRVLLPRSVFRAEIKQSKDVLLAGLGFFTVALIRYGINFLEDPLEIITEKMQKISIKETMDLT